jgi:hypothetical protein
VRRPAKKTGRPSGDNGKRRRAIGDVLGKMLGYALN